MVFEYMEQDLDHFIRQCPAPGMVESTVKVKLIFVYILCIKRYDNCHMHVIEFLAELSNEVCYGLLEVLNS